jgi:hydroxyethylthiazole kinase
MNTTEIACELLETLRAQQDKAVHCLVGDMSLDLTAQVLSALGARISMTHDAREADDFVDRAAAVLVQVASLSELKESGMLTAVDTARRHGKPWVLQPRQADRSIFRGELAHRLAENRPRVIYGRPKELAAIKRSVRPIELIDLAKFSKATVICPQKTVRIVGVLRQTELDISSNFLATTVGMDSAISAICALFCAIEPDGFKAACAAMLVVQAASDRAHRAAAGPGSYPVMFLDALYALTPDTLSKVQPLEVVSTVT